MPLSDFVYYALFFFVKFYLRLSDFVEITFVKGECKTNVTISYYFPRDGQYLGLKSGIF